VHQKVDGQENNEAAQPGAASTSLESDAADELREDTKPHSGPSREQQEMSYPGVSSPTALVIRGGETKQIPARHVVPGDVVTIKPGDVVPADVRLFSVARTR